MRTVFHNCFWKSGITVTQSGTNASQASTYTVRIPMSEAGTGFQAAAGDIAILGEAAEEITGKSPNTASEIMQKHKPNAFRVTAYSDNTGHRMDKHYRLGG